MTSTLVIALLQIAAGFVLLIWAADRLISGASALARNLGVSPLIVGLTIVGFGTSAPEMLVSALASLRGSPSLAIGNAIGSNIANIGLILGITGLIYPLKVESVTLKREFPVLAFIMFLTLALMLNLELSRSDGTILALGLFALVGGMVLLGIKSEGNDPMAASLTEEVPEGMPMRTALIWTATGLILLPLSAHILVDGAVTLALFLGVSDALIGLTIIAFGTSLPELAAATTAALKKEDDLAIGNILGSNMFNLLGVLGIAALIAPMQIEPSLLYRDVAVMFALTIFLFMAIWRRSGPGLITRPVAGAMLAVFLIYQGLIIHQGLG
ncbi:calcium/sodium antiporter [Wenzhouxiangella marina]|uniref:Ca2+/Na+ antiporter n=1 Tax=Wenzhouxiangella marina TaxID=1579979 RepID=A0A0K0XTS3_9GAMM|nr:calcium/sodium antiporter [Wenzhouxiangella marina]AKS41022.1 Ca2+/Na+ antiporter [Wenzhouxiangella marina]MBB6087900.1 cation:H+ antiporter [Wenzhouxiangella marina]